MDFDLSELNSEVEDLEFKKATDGSAVAELIDIRYGVDDDASETILNATEELPENTIDPDFRLDALEEVIFADDIEGIVIDTDEGE